MHYVTIFILEDGYVDSLIGPFPDPVAAMDWIDQDSTIRLAEDPKYVRESSDEIVMVACDLPDGSVKGYMWQVLSPSEPVAIADAELPPVREQLAIPVVEVSPSQPSES